MASNWFEWLYRDGQRGVVVACLNALRISTTGMKIVRWGKGEEEIWEWKRELDNATEEISKKFT